MDNTLLAQPSWALFLIKYTDLLLTIAIVYFAFFFSLVTTAILFPSLRTKRLTLPGIRSDGHAYNGDERDIGHRSG